MRTNIPGLTQPDESYHGLTYTKAFGKKGLHDECKRPTDA
jgi:O-acetylhomoserine sulfhydrylase